MPERLRAASGAVFLAAAAWGSGLWAAIGCSSDNAAPADLGAPDSLPLADRGCSNTQTDPHNCGTCGHDCRGGGCQSGACIPLASGVLASGQRTPGGIVVDATEVYWVNRGTYSSARRTYDGAQIVKCAKSGCDNRPTVLATGSWTDITNPAVDHGYIYWGASGRIFQCATSGCGDGPTLVWSGAGSADEIVLDDGGLYFDLPNSDQVLACPVDRCDAGTPLPIFADAAAGFPAALLKPGAIAVDDDDFYEITAGSEGVVASCTLIACSSGMRLLATVPNGAAMFAPLLAVDATLVYFAAAGDPNRRLPGGNAFGGNPSAAVTISSISKDATNPSPTTTLLGGLSAPSAMAVGGANLYVADVGAENDAGVRLSGVGRIAKCAVAGCGDVATVVQDYVNYPQGLAVDEAHVYWTDFGSGTDPLGGDDGRVMVRPR